MSRSKTIITNSAVVISSQIIQILLIFIVRKIFIATLGVEYLGYNSVFLNVLQMLNLADLGFGVAITSFLYKPIAKKNKDEIATLMTIYKKIYRVVGVIVIVIGGIVSAFLGVIIPDNKISLWYLRLLFYISLTGTASTYFLAYKRTLIISDQKAYIVNLVDMIVNMAASITQIILLCVCPNFALYLLVNILKAIIANLILSYKCSKIYGDFAGGYSGDIGEKYKLQIFQYVKDVFISRIGAVVYYGTDNIIISIIRGSMLAGFLSNYSMITTYLITIVSQLFTSIQATYGNYASTVEDVNKEKNMTDNYLCASFIVGNFGMSCFVFLVQPFIELYFGRRLLLPFSVALWLGLNLLLTIMLQIPSQVFIVYKLFRYDKPIIIVSAILNIVLSILLVKRLGIVGALIGTFVTSLIYLFSRIYIISKHVFKVSYVSYLGKLFFYFGISLLTIVICHLLIGKTETEGWFGFAIRAVYIGVISSTCSITMMSVTNEFKFLCEKLLPSKARLLLRPIVIIPIAVILIGLLFVLRRMLK